jgi:hypothetical protein
MYRSIINKFNRAGQRLMSVYYTYCVKNEQDRNKG